MSDDRGGLRGAAGRGSKKSGDPILQKHLQNDDESEETVRINVKLPRWMRKEFAQKAKEEGYTMSEIVRGYVEHYLEL